MTKIQREELDLDVKHLDCGHEWKPLNVRVVRDGTPWAKWFIAGLALAIAVIIGAEVIFHAWAVLRG